MKFFLGGVPFGCDNIGDEAILAGVVKILRRNFENPEICVATAKPEETAKLLNVSAVPLYGIGGKYPQDALESELKKHDVFIWSGATGLSDYPYDAVNIVESAQKLGLKTIVWGVGMDSTLNPAFFKLGGKKLTLAKLFSFLSFGAINFVEKWEKNLVLKARKRIAQVLKNCDLIVLRDPQSKEELLKCDSSLKVFVGADSAIIINEKSALENIDEKARESLEGDYEKIGVCISAQRRVPDLRPMAEALDKLLASQKRRMFFIPMNPKSDAEVAKNILKFMELSEKTHVMYCCEQPEDVLALASRCNVVISSRLHLLILSANVSTPPVGISRGSKVDNFLSQFGIDAVGDVYSCNYRSLIDNTENFISNERREIFEQTCSGVYAELNRRLNEAEKLLTEACCNT